MLVGKTKPRSIPNYFRVVWTVGIYYPSPKQWDKKNLAAGEMKPLFHNDKNVN